MTSYWLANIGNADLAKDAINIWEKDRNMDTQRKSLKSNLQVYEGMQSNLF